LVVGGALKLVDPSGSVGALRALGLPASTDRVRVLAGGEVILGMLAWSVSSRVLAALVALSYAAFFAVTVLALVRKLPIDSCGCLGKLETPPSWRHLVVLGLAFLGALGITVDPRPALFERIDDGAAGVALAILVVVGMLIAVGVMRAGRRPWTPASGS
jgi:hypothetical protein